MQIALIGASGLVGAALLERLLVDHDVLVLARRPLGVEHPRLRERIAPIADWPAALDGEALDAAISTLGTTIRQAGSRDAFEAVDLDAVVAFARAARAAGARHVVAVSSVGANPLSRNFYLRTKGRMERALAALGFERVDALRPGLLRGKRAGRARPGERLALLLSPIVGLILRGRLSRYAAIPAATVAKAAAALVTSSGEGTHTHENRALRRLARSA